MASRRIVIVGGGIAGLAAARTCEQAGVDWHLLEASENLGGRIATDRQKGFILDRGFQVFNTAYKTVSRLLDPNQLELRPFLPGARVYAQGQSTTFIDPRRAPAAALKLGRVPSWRSGDYLRLLSLLREAKSFARQEPSGARNVTTIAELENRGFSQRIIDGFFKPFFAGVFLDNELTISWSRFLHQLSNFNEGLACLPREGMSQIAKGMSEGLTPARVRLGCPVESIAAGSVKTADGEAIHCDRIVLSVDPQNAIQLAGLEARIDMQHVSCVYFAAEHPPYPEPLLAIPAATETGPVATFAVLTNVQPSYSASDRALISVSSLSCQPEDSLAQAVLTQLESWFGRQVRNWELIRSYAIPNALPNQSPAALNLPVDSWSKRLRQMSIYLCGDYTAVPSIEGAAVSGSQTARIALDD